METIYLKPKKLNGMAEYRSITAGAWKYIRGVKYSCNFHGHDSVYYFSEFWKMLSSYLYNSYIEIYESEFTTEQWVEIKVLASNYAIKNNAHIFISASDWKNGEMYGRKIFEKQFKQELSK